MLIEKNWRALKSACIKGLSRTRTLKCLNAFIISCVFICRVLIFTCKRHNKLNMRHCLCMFIFAYESEHW